MWFGGFAAIAMLFGFFAVGVLQRRFERRGTESIARVLFVSTAVLAAAQLVFALTGVAAVAVVTLLAALLARQLLAPLWDIWVNQQITDSSVRATVNSIPARPTQSARPGGLGARPRWKPLRTGGRSGSAPCSMPRSRSTRARSATAAGIRSSRTPGGGVVIRRAETAADLDTYARVWSQVHPDLPISGEEVRRRVAETGRREERLLAEAEGVPSESATRAARACMTARLRSFQR